MKKDKLFFQIMKKIFLGHHKELRILIQQKLTQKKVQTAQRKKPILNPNDPVQIRHSKSCEDIFLSYPTAVEIRNIAEAFEASA